MDFERILQEWEASRRQRSEPERRRSQRYALEQWIDRYPPEPGEADPELYVELDDEQGGDPSGRRAGRRLAVEAELDLHGYTIEQAAAALEQFIRQSLETGVRKVLVIHGKGKHSSDKAVLPEFVRSFLQAHSAIGEIGTPKRSEGGSGATWAIVRGYRSR